MGDWLGTGAVATFLRQYLPFNKARAFARSLGLKSRTEWREYCASGKKPADIPSNPQRVYANDGWSGMGDWLGYAHNTQARERNQTVPPVTEGPNAPVDQSYNS